MDLLDTLLGSLDQRSENVANKRRKKRKSKGRCYEPEHPRWAHPSAMWGTSTLHTAHTTVTIAPTTWYRSPSAMWGMSTLHRACTSMILLLYLRGVSHVLCPPCTEYSPPWYCRVRTFMILAWGVTAMHIATSGVEAHQQCGACPPPPTTHHEVHNNIHCPTTKHTTLLLALIAISWDLQTWTLVNPAWIWGFSDK